VPDADPTLIAINPVLADRADDFADWLRSVVVPAVVAHRPDLQGRYRVLRATEADDGTVPFVFLCTGGHPDDWDLEPILEQALGADGMRRALATMRDMLRDDQYGWFFTPVDVGA